MRITEIFILRIWLVLSFIALASLVNKELSETEVVNFDTIEAKRINMREADGTLRLVIANQELQSVGSLNGEPIHKPGASMLG